MFFLPHNLYIQRENCGKLSCILFSQGMGSQSFYICFVSSILLEYLIECAVLFFHFKFLKYASNSKAHSPFLGIHVLSSIKPP